MLLYIAYRGLFNGQDPQAENTTNQIGTAFNNGFAVMIDLWRENDKLYLGSEEPMTEVTEKYIQGNRFWINARNTDAQEWISSQPLKLYPQYFWQTSPEETYVTTSNGYLWTFQTTPINNQSIMVLPETQDSGLFSTVHYRCFGVCSIFVKFIKRIRQEGGNPYSFPY